MNTQIISHTAANSMASLIHTNIQTSHQLIPKAILEFPQLEMSEARNKIRMNRPQHILEKVLDLKFQIKVSSRILIQQREKILKETSIKKKDIRLTKNRDIIMT